MAQTGRDAIAAVERALLGEEARLTRADVESSSGVPREVASGLWRALGFVAGEDDSPAFTERDVDAVRDVLALMENDLVDLAAAEAIGRAMGKAMATLADVQLQVMAEQLAKMPAMSESIKTGPGAVVELSLTLGADVLEPLERLMDYVWRRHLVAAAQRALTGATRELGDGSQPLGVGFCDVVGFTSLSRDLDQEALGELVSSFERVAFDVVITGGGRVVKTLGDEVMFVTDEAVTAARIALDLAAVFEAGRGPVPAVHIGVGYGPALPRHGDVFGPVVNVASRCTGLARAGTVLVDRGMIEELEHHSEFALRRLRPQRVRGYEHLTVAVLRRSAEDAVSEGKAS